MNSEQKGNAMAEQGRDNFFLRTVSEGKPCLQFVYDDGNPAAFWMIESENPVLISMFQSQPNRTEEATEYVKQALLELLLSLVDSTTRLALDNLDALVSGLGGFTCQKNPDGEGFVVTTPLKRAKGQRHPKELGQGETTLRAVVNAVADSLSERATGGGK